MGSKITVLTARLLSIQLLSLNVMFLKNYFIGQCLSVFNWQSKL
jgi:hypothetical protein